MPNQTKPDTRILTPETLAEIEARASAATKGPWQRGGNYWDINTVTADNGDHFIADCNKNPLSAEFIAHARADIPALCQTVRAAWQQYEGAVSDFAAEINSLRAQLAQVEGERASWRRVAERLEREKINAESQLAQVERERDALLKHVADLNHDLDAAVKEMNDHG